MDDDTINPDAGGAEGEGGEEKEIDPDVMEDSFDDVDNL